MKLKELLGKAPENFKDIEIKGITQDSRNISKGDAFICIKGANFDGHSAALKAEELGAAVIIAEKDTGAKNQIIVSDTREALAEMSSNYFGNPSKKLKIIGVTGTNGKTSVTYMIKQVLEYFGHKVGLIGTIHNLICNEEIATINTTPGAFELNKLFAKMVEAGCEYAVMEVSSHALDQKRVFGIEFEAAVFTNLTQDHLDYHETMDNYFYAKSKLFSMCKKAILNFDDSYTEKLSELISAPKITYSLISNNSTYSAKDITYRPDGVSYTLVGFNAIQKFSVSIGGKFTVYNTMAAICVLNELGFELSEISKAISQMSGIKGRAEVVPTGKDFTVIIDYAHTPDGLVNILRSFKVFKESRLVVLFGCGGDRDKLKRPIMGKVASQYADYVIITSDNPRSEEPMSIIEDIEKGIIDTKTPYKIIENRVDAINFAIKNAKSRDIIVLAGKGHETYQILKNGKIDLDERELVAKALEEK